MNRNIVKPMGLKGQENINRIIKLMGNTVNESTKNSVVELSKVGPDGKVYGIVRENHNYYIKTVNSDKKSNLIVEDFQYAGGLQNKNKEAYPTYAKAIKQLNLKFLSLNEAFGGSRLNVFKNDNLDYASTKNAIVEVLSSKGVDVNESNIKIGSIFKDINTTTLLNEDLHSQGGDRMSDVRLVIDKLVSNHIEVNLDNVLVASLFLPAGEFTGGEEGMIEDAIQMYNDEKNLESQRSKRFWAEGDHRFDMTEDEELIDRMVEGKDPIVPKKKKTNVLKIGRAIHLEESDNKLDDLVNSLSPNEAVALIEALKKKV